MKRILLAAFLASLMALEAKEERFEVSKVGADKTRLIEIFEKVKLVESGGGKTLTEKEFVQALKDGETWLLKNYETKNCFYCFGKGHLGSLRDNKKCPSCNGKGSRVVDLLVKW